MSLSVLLEISAAHDFLRGLLSLLQEYDTIDDENLKAKTVSRSFFYTIAISPLNVVYDQKNLFKQGKAKRPSGTGDYPLSVQESGDLSYFFSPNIVRSPQFSYVLLCTNFSLQIAIRSRLFPGPMHALGYSIGSVSQDPLLPRALTFYSLSFFSKSRFPWLSTACYSYE